MAYMQLTYRNASSQLSPQEIVQIRHEAAAREQEICEAARTLNRILNHGDNTTNIQRVLDKFTPQSTTQVPKRFLMSTPTIHWASSRSKKHDRAFYNQTHNRSYTRRLLKQRQRQRKASTLADHYFQIPNAPLPLSFEAQQDINHVNHVQRPNRLVVESGYAPLFSKANSNLSAANMSPAEREALEFLTPPDRSPKTETLERLQELPHFVRSDPTARVAYNTPKHFPDLHRRVPSDFQAACVDKQTACFEGHCAGNAERVALNKSPKEYAMWY